jgi:DNA polymerase I
VSEGKKKLCLIDGSGYIFRAFYAIPEMRRKDGIPVHAVYGFTSMMMQFLKENCTDYMAVVFDAQRKNFRNEIYPEYKATRKEVPEELIPQFPLIRQAVAALQVACVEEEGFEADDLIASYTRQALDKNMEVIVVSSDKDLMQLLRSGVQMMDPMKKKMITDADVFEKFGVTPDKVTQVQALQGDATDNIPGVKGIGPKSAAQLINQFGTLENLYLHLEEVSSQRWKKLLTEDKEKAFISEKLVSLDANAPVPAPIESFQVKETDLSKLRSFLQENEFKSLERRLEEWGLARHNSVDGLSKKKDGDFLKCVQGENLTSGEKSAEKTGLFFDEKKQDGAGSLTKTAVSAEELTSIFKNNPRLHYSVVKTEAELALWVQKIYEAGFVALYAQTDHRASLTERLVGFSLCVSPFEACYVPIRHAAEEELVLEPPQQTDLFFSAKEKTHAEQISIQQAMALMEPVLTDDSILKIGHDIKLDAHIFQKESKKEISLTPLEDIAVMTYSAFGTSVSCKLNDMGMYFLGEKVLTYYDISKIKKHREYFHQVSLELAAPYMAQQADVILRLYRQMKEEVHNRQAHFIYESVDRPLVAVLKKMEQNGIRIDTEELHRLERDFASRMQGLMQRIYELAGEEFNVNSPSQIGRIIYEKLKLTDPQYTTNGSYATQAHILEKMAADGFEFPQKILDYRLLSKLKSTYVDSFIFLTKKDTRIHTTFLQTSTNTGRLASMEPNLQNIPIRSEEGRLIRGTFIADSGNLLMSADYSQIELRLIASVADVHRLKQAFTEGKDIHAITASQVFDIPLEKVDALTRRHAKAINFGIIYGISAFGLAEQLGISRHEAAAYIDKYMKEYPEIHQYMEQTIQQARRFGYVKTIFGRRCVVQGILDKNVTLRNAAERAAVNAPIQGSGADIIKLAMLDVAREIEKRRLKSRMLLQIHDELIFEVPQKEEEEMRALLKEKMEGVVSLSVPLEVKIGAARNWKDAH